jgi:hypothetical protein
LYPFAVWCVPNERKDRSDALDEERALVRLSVVQRGLDTVVAVRVTQELLEAGAVQEFLDEDLTCAVFCDTNTLLQLHQILIILKGF